MNLKPHLFLLIFGCASHAAYANTESLYQQYLTSSPHFREGRKSTFNDVTFNPVAQNDGQIWLTSSELAKALGYVETDSVSKIYNRNKDEFTSNMTTTVKMGVVRKTGEVIMSVRIFSLRGCHLLAMFAKTEIAKQFRKWVLDILDKEVGQPVITTTDPQLELSMVADRKPLVKAVNMLVNETGAIVSNVWRMVHQQFNIESIEELTKAQVKEAVAYVHGLFLVAAKGAAQTHPATNQALYQMVFHAVSSHHQLYRMTRNLANTLLVSDQVRQRLIYLRERIIDASNFAEQHDLRNPFGCLVVENGHLNAWTGSRMSIAVTP